MHLGVEFVQGLSAHTARRAPITSNHGARDHVLLALADSFDNSSALSTYTDRIRRVLDVAALKNLPALSQDGGADLVLRVRYIRMLTPLYGCFYQGRSLLSCYRHGLFFGEKGLGEKPQGIHLHLKIKFLIFALHTTISAIAYTGATIAVSVAAAHRTVDEGHADIGDAEVALMAVSAAYAAVYFTGRIVGLVR